MVYEAWVAPSFEAAGCVAPRFCGIGTDRSPLIIDAARDVTPALSKPTAWQAAPQPGSATARHRHSSAAPRPLRTSPLDVRLHLRTQTGLLGRGSAECSLTL